jgi:CelD/BcsL family acetyltransferase involved in cellulose biosynthesis
MPDQVEIIPWQQSPAVLGKWRDCVRLSTNIRAWMQTPEWLDFKWRPFAQTYIATLSDEQSGDILAITPLASTNFALKFSIRGTELVALSLNSLLLIGSDPLFPASEQNYQALCRAVLAMPSIDCFYLPDVPTSSQFWAFLAKAQKANPDWLFYVPEFAFCRCYYIDTSMPHEQYLAQFKPKTLQEYRRKFRLLEKAVGATLELIRIRSPEEVGAFLDAAQAIAERSWQRRLIGIAVEKAAERREFLENMARRGLLRSYLLRAGENVIAFELGFQMNGTLFFFETAFDPAYVRFSPGHTLFNLVIKDCFEIDRPTMIHYGPGDMTYKKMLANRHGEEITILILKKTFGNRAKVAGHRLFRKGIAIIKTCLGLERRD